MQDKLRGLWDDDGDDDEYEAGVGKGMSALGFGKKKSPVPRPPSSTEKPVEVPSVAKADLSSPAAGTETPRSVAVSLYDSDDENDIKKKRASVEAAARKAKGEGNRTRERDLLERADKIEQDKRRLQVQLDTERQTLETEQKNRRRLEKMLNSERDARKQEEESKLKLEIELKSMHSKYVLADAEKADMSSAYERLQQVLRDERKEREENNVVLASLRSELERERDNLKYEESQRRLKEESEDTLRSELATHADRACKLETRVKELEAEVSAFQKEASEARLEKSLLMEQSRAVKESSRVQGDETIRQLKKELHMQIELREKRESEQQSLMEERDRAIKEAQEALKKIPGAEDGKWEKMYHSIKEEYRAKWDDQIAKYDQARSQLRVAQEEVEFERREKEEVQRSFKRMERVASQYEDLERILAVERKDMNDRMAVERAHLMEQMDKTLQKERAETLERIEGEKAAILREIHLEASDGISGSYKPLAQVLGEFKAQCDEEILALKASLNAETSRCADLEKKLADESKERQSMYENLAREKSERRVLVERELSREREVVEKRLLKERDEMTHSMQREKEFWEGRQTIAFEQIRQEFREQIEGLEASLTKERLLREKDLNKRLELEDECEKLKVDLDRAVARRSSAEEALERVLRANEESLNAVVGISPDSPSKSPVQKAPLPSPKGTGGKARASPPPTRTKRVAKPAEVSTPPSAEIGNSNMQNRFKSLLNTVEKEKQAMQMRLEEEYEELKEELARERRKRQDQESGIRVMENTFKAPASVSVAFEPKSLAANEGPDDSSVLRSEDQHQTSNRRTTRSESMLDESPFASKPKIGWDAEDSPLPGDAPVADFELSPSRGQLSPSRVQPPTSARSAGKATPIGGKPTESWRDKIVLSTEDVPYIVEDMMEGPNDVELQQQGCASLRRVCAGAHKATKAEVIAFRGVDCVTRAVSAHMPRPGIVQNACEALSAMACNFAGLDVRGAEAALKNSGTLGVLLSAMGVHRYSPDILEKIINLLKEIVMSEGLRSDFMLRSTGALKNVINLLMEHSSSPSFSNACFALLRELCKEMKFIDMFAGEGGVAAVLRVMKCLEREGNVLTSGCLLLEAICTHDVVLDRVAQSGGIDVIIKAMSAHSSKSMLQTNACDALRQMARVPNIRLSIIKAGAIPLVRSATRLQTHGAAQQVLKVLNVDRSPSPVSSGIKPAGKNTDNKIDNKIRAMFQRHDEDESGFIDTREFETFCTSLGLLMGKEELEGVMNKIGQSGKISLPSFLRWFHGDADEEPDPNIARMLDFDRMAEAEMDQRKKMIGHQHANRAVEDKRQKEIDFENVKWNKLVHESQDGINENVLKEEQPQEKRSEEDLQILLSSENPEPLFAPVDEEVAKKIWEGQSTNNTNVEASSDRNQDSITSQELRGSVEAERGEEHKEHAEPSETTNPPNRDYVDDSVRGTVIVTFRSGLNLAAKNGAIMNLHASVHVRGKRIYSSKSFKSSMPQFNSAVTIKNYRMNETLTLKVGSRMSTIGILNLDVYDLIDGDVKTLWFNLQESHSKDKLSLGTGKKGFNESKVPQMKISLAYKPSEGDSTQGVDVDNIKDEDEDEETNVGEIIPHDEWVVGTHTGNVNKASQILKKGAKS